MTNEEGVVKGIDVSPQETVNAPSAQRIIEPEEFNQIREMLVENILEKQINEHNRSEILENFKEKLGSSTIEKLNKLSKKLGNSTYEQVTIKARYLAHERKLKNIKKPGPKERIYRAAGDIKLKAYKEIIKLDPKEPRLPKPRKQKKRDNENRKRYIRKQIRNKALIAAGLVALGCFFYREKLPSIVKSVKGRIEEQIESHNDTEYAKNNPEILYIKDKSGKEVFSGNRLRLARKARLRPRFTYFLFHLKDGKGRHLFDMPTIVKAHKSRLNENLVLALHSMNYNKKGVVFDAESMLEVAEQRLYRIPYLESLEEKVGEIENSFPSDPKYPETWEDKCAFVRYARLLDKVNRPIVKVKGKDIIDAFNHSIPEKDALEMLTIPILKGKDLSTAWEAGIKPNYAKSMYAEGGYWIGSTSISRKKKNVIKNVDEIIKLWRQDVTPDYMRELMRFKDKNKKPIFRHVTEILGAKKYGVTEQYIKQLMKFNVFHSGTVIVDAKKYGITKQYITQLLRFENIFKTGEEIVYAKKHRLTTDHIKTLKSIKGIKASSLTMYELRNYYSDEEIDARPHILQEEYHLFKTARQMVNAKRYGVTQQYVKMLGQFKWETNGWGRTIFLFNDTEETVINAKRYGVKKQYIEQIMQIEAGNLAVFPSGESIINAKKNGLTPQYIKQIMQFKDLSDEFELFRDESDIIKAKKAGVTAEYIEQLRKFKYRYLRPYDHGGFRYENGNRRYLFPDANSIIDAKKAGVTEQYVKQLLQIDFCFDYDELIIYAKKTGVTPQYIKKLIKYKDKSGKPKFKAWEIIYIKEKGIKPEDYKR